MYVACARGARWCHPQTPPTSPPTTHAITARQFVDHLSTSVESIFSLSSIILGSRSSVHLCLAPPTLCLVLYNAGRNNAYRVGVHYVTLGWWWWLCFYKWLVIPMSGLHCHSCEKLNLNRFKYTHKYTYIRTHTHTHTYKQTH